MTADAKLYPYRRLAQTPLEIRLFTLHPGLPGTPIRGSLSHHVLDDELAFDALSYKWGDPAATDTILLNDGHELPVARNLHRALDDLRDASAELVIWIDAICINQADTAERNHQVQILRSIFTKARLVHAWLDHTIDPADPAFVKLKSFVKDRQLGIDPFGPDTEIADLGDDTVFWAPVVAMLCDPYWNRVWIQQEIVLARRYAVHCRRDLVPGEGIVEFTASVYHYVRRDFETPSPRWHDWVGVSNAMALTHTRAKLLSDSRAEDSGLLFNLRFAGRLELTDPRDRLYGLLGLSCDVDGDDIVVDYDATVAQTFA